MISRQKLIEEIFYSTRHEVLYGSYDCYEANTVLEIIDEIIEMIKSQPPADQWIPCSSGKMPKDGQSVVVTIAPKNAHRHMVVLAYYKARPKYFTERDWNGEGFYHGIWGDWIKRENVIAWMPAEPYKGVE